MVLNEKAVKWFCKCYKVPISVTQVNLFLERVTILTRVNNKLHGQFMLFVEDLKNFDSFEDYETEYYTTVDKAVEFIKNTEGYQRFNSQDMNQYGVKTSLPSGDVYKGNYVGKKFLSFDMSQANFTSLYYFDFSIFDGTQNYEEFLSKFTNYDSIRKSKHIRQVIFGKLNPKRQITYEKYLMSQILSVLDTSSVACFNNDEIVLNINTDEDYSNLIDKVLSISQVKLSVNTFTLKKLTNGLCTMYVKCYDNGDLALKCTDSDFVHIAVKNIFDLPVADSDYIFDFKGVSAVMQSVPRFKIEG